MKEITVKLYEYDELSPEARTRAHEDWLSKGYEHFWGGEVRDTLKKLEEEFGIEVSRWSYDSCSHDCGVIRWKNWSDDQLALSGERARAFLWNNFGHLLLTGRYYSKFQGTRHARSKFWFDRVYDGTCPLTGVCFDNDALDPLAYFCFGVKWDEKANKRVMVPHDERWRWKSTTVEEIICDCVDSLFESAQRDCEHQESEEYFDEMCTSNGWTFEEDGRRRDAE